MEITSKRRLASLMLWWCEGTKIRKDKRWKNAFNYSIELTNTDPKLIKIFVDFLRNDMGVFNIKLRGQLQIHEGDNKNGLEKFWSNISGIPISQFNKTIVRNLGNKAGKTKGTFKVRLYDKMLFEKLKSLLEAELNEIITGSSSVG